MFASSLLDPLYNIVSSVLAAFYQYTHSFAVSIALLTLIINLLVLPLTLKSTKSMLEMQRIQPEVKKLQDQYKGDVQARNEAMMALYKEHNVNPLGGCVPMLLPLPVFIVMYRTVSGLTRLCTDKLLADAKYSAFSKTTFCPDHIKATSRMFVDLAGKSKMMSFGLDLASSAKNQIANNLVRGLPYLLLVLVVGGTGYYQQRQITLRNTGQPVNPQQQMLLRVMPAGFALFSLIFPAALIVYFIVGNATRIAQNAYITRRFFGADGLAEQVAKVRAEAEPVKGKETTGKATTGKATTGKATTGKATTGTARPEAARQAPKPGKGVTPPKGTQTPSGRPRPTPPSKPGSSRPRPTPKGKGQ